MHTHPHNDRCGQTEMKNTRTPSHHCHTHSIYTTRQANNAFDSHSGYFMRCHSRCTKNERNKFHWLTDRRTRHTLTNFVQNMTCDFFVRLFRLFFSQSRFDIKITITHLCLCSQLGTVHDRSIFEIVSCFLYSICPRQHSFDSKWEKNIALSRGC